MVLAALEAPIVGVNGSRAATTPGTFNAWLEARGFLPRQNMQNMQCIKSVCSTVRVPTCAAMASQRLLAPPGKRLALALGAIDQQLELIFLPGTRA